MQEKDIEEILSQLEQIYNQQTEDNNISLVSNELLCKMASLELCAWLEDYFDNLMIMCKNNFINSIPNYPTDQEIRKNLTSWINHIDKKIKDTHGMAYTTHFRKLLVELLGDMAVLKLEYEIGLSDIQKLSNILDELHKDRAILAHQSLINIIQQKRLNSPSITLQTFKHLYPILLKFKSALNTLNVNIKTG